MKKTIFIITVILAILSITLYQTDNSQKEFLIDNANTNKLEKISDNTFIIDSLDGYYTEKTISFQPDSSYTIICWGDRNSLLWYIRKDKMIHVSIPYNRYKNIDVDTDVRLMCAFYQNLYIR